MLDHMVRLEFDIVQDSADHQAANIFSFYSNYYDYLDEYNLIEVSLNLLIFEFSPSKQNYSKNKQTSTKSQPMSGPVTREISKATTWTTTRTSQRLETSAGIALRT